MSLPLVMHRSLFLDHAREDGYVYVDDVLSKIQSSAVSGAVALFFAVPCYVGEGGSLCV